MHPHLTNYLDKLEKNASHFYRFSAINPLNNSFSVLELRSASHAVNGVCMSDAILEGARQGHVSRPNSRIPFKMFTTALIFVRS